MDLAEVWIQLCLKRGECEPRKAGGKHEAAPMQYLGRSWRATSCSLGVKLCSRVATQSG